MTAEPWAFFLERPALFEGADGAACVGVDLGVFYGERFDGDRVDQAKAICATCSVKEPCLDYAITYGERWGVWGQTTEKERRSLRRRRRASSR